MSVTSSTKKESSFGETVRVVIHALIIALVIRTFLFQPFNIPSGSMKATLLVGDYLFVSKYSYGYSHYSIPLSPPLFSGRVFGSEPARGDIVVFRLPKDDSIDYIKRVIGLPGDRIALRDGRVIINGTPVGLTPDGSGHAESEDGSNTTAARYIETLPDGRKHVMFKLTPAEPLDNMAEVTVPPGHLFVMGDNRDNSADSRVPLRDGGVGMLPVNDLVGRVDAVVGSWDLGMKHQPIWTWPSGLRLARFFTAVH